MLFRPALCLISFALLISAQITTSPAAHFQLASCANWTRIGTVTNHTYTYSPPFTAIAYYGPDASLANYSLPTLEIPAELNVTTGGDSGWDGTSHNISFPNGSVLDVTIQSNASYWGCCPQGDGVGPSDQQHRLVGEASFEGQVMPCRQSAYDYTLYMRYGPDPSDLTDVRERCVGFYQCSLDLSWTPNVPG